MEAVLSLRGSHPQLLQHDSLKQKINHDSTIKCYLSRVVGQLEIVGAGHDAGEVVVGVDLDSQKVRGNLG